MMAPVNDTYFWPLPKPSGIRFDVVYFTLVNFDAVEFTLEMLQMPH
jgi:hypothetical protein